MIERKRESIIHPRLRRKKLEELTIAYIHTTERAIYMSQISYFLNALKKCIFDSGLFDNSNLHEIKEVTHLFQTLKSIHYKGTCIYVKSHKDIKYFALFLTYVSSNPWLFFSVILFTFLPFNNKTYCLSHKTCILLQVDICLAYVNHYSSLNEIITMFS